LFDRSGFVRGELAAEDEALVEAPARYMGSLRGTEDGKWVGVLHWIVIEIARWPVGRWVRRRLLG
jgi:hypothetical protein